MAFFVKPGLDQFLNGVMDALSDENEVVKNLVTSLGQIEPALEKADIAWFEWCDELVLHASKLPIARERKILCRLHSYEAFTDYPAQVNWDAVDRVIFVSESIRAYATEKFGIVWEKTSVIPNGLPMENYRWRARAHGHKVAYAGYVNYKKGPMLLLHTFKAMHDLDGRYRLHIAGAFQDERDILYFRQMIPLLGLQGSVAFDGWQEDLDAWLEDVDYILCTSVLESQNMSVMQAMAKGIKPIVHRFVGAGTIYPEDCLFNTIPEAVSLLGSKYDSARYRRFVEDYCGMEKIALLLHDEIRRVESCESKAPLVSIVMPVYNRERYLGEAIQSALDQSYGRIELIVVNDGSTDGSERVARSFRDERIRYYSQENAGQLEALKKGMLEARGDYVCRLDSDDRLDRDYVRACLEEMLRDRSLRFVYTDMLSIGPDGEPLGEVRLKDYADPKRLILDVLANFSSPIPDVSFWAKAYAPRVLENYAGQNVPFYIDNILSAKFGHVARPLYHYRRHGANFAASPDNLRYVLSGKIRFIDLLIRKYFIQSDAFGLCRRDRAGVLAFFGRYFEELRAAHARAGAEQAVLDQFRRQADFWARRASGADSAEHAFLNHRILVASADDPLDGRAVGGKHAHIHLLMRALAERNVPCALATCALKPEETVDLKSLARDFAPPPEALDDREDQRKDRNFLCLVYAMQKSLEEKLRAHLSDHFVSCISCQDVIAASAARRVLTELNMEIPVVTTLHGYFADENVDYGLLQSGGAVYGFFREYERRACEASDRIVAVDGRIAAYAEGLTGGRVQTTVLQNAVDDEAFRMDGEVAEEDVVLVPRRLVPKNGVAFAVLAAHVLAGRDEGFTMLIAGDGPERPAIEALIAANRLEGRVRLLGSVPHDQVHALYGRAKVVLIPSVPSNNVEEATSLAALEGLACGKAVVASAIGGLKEMIRHGQNGFLVAPGDPRAIADALTEALRMDGARYREMGRTARADVEREHGYRNHAEKLLAVFAECADGLLFDGRNA